MIEAAIFSQLTQDAEVSNIVGNRVYPVEAPEGTKTPYITYREMSQSEYQGPSETEISKTFQFDSHPNDTIDSPSYKQAKELAWAIRNALHMPFAQNGFCVSLVDVGTQSDELYQGIHQHGVGSLFTFTYYISE